MTAALLSCLGCPRWFSFVFWLVRLASRDCDWEIVVLSILIPLPLVVVVAGMNVLTVATWLMLEGTNLA